MNHHTKMSSSTLFSPFLLTLLLLLFLIISPSYSCCPITTCKNETTAQVRFPFRLYDQNPQNCSYRGFDLFCTDQGFIALNLSHAGTFLVRFISYGTQSIRLYDPNNCTPKRLLDGFDPSGSPFQSDFYVNYTFLTCPRSFIDSRFSVIDCLSNVSTSVIATSHSMFAKEVSEKSCKVIKSLLVPVSIPENDGLTSSLEDDIWLSWTTPDCRDCEADGGVCSFHGNGNKTIGCFYGFRNEGDPHHEDNNKGLKIFRIIALSIAGPAIVCAMAVGTLLCIIDRRGARTSGNPGQGQTAVTPQNQQTVTGLDQSTIDSYTKVILGESRRVPGLNDGSCPICLSDFNAKETLRCIPDCKHCFHAECIDEWLRMNGTCPVCRNSPLHHLEVEAS